MGRQSGFVSDENRIGRVGRTRCQPAGRAPVGTAGRKGLLLGGEAWVGGDGVAEERQLGVGASVGGEAPLDEERLQPVAEPVQFDEYGRLVG